MITIDKQIQERNGTIGVNATFYGLSTDTKPTTKVSNGSCFIEMDTGKAYFFDAENSEWLEAGGN